MWRVVEWKWQGENTEKLGPKIEEVSNWEPSGNLQSSNTFL